MKTFRQHLSEVQNTQYSEGVFDWINKKLKEKKDKKAADTAISFIEKHVKEPLDKALNIIKDPSKKKEMEDFIRKGLFDIYGKSGNERDGGKNEYLVAFDMRRFWNGEVKNKLKEIIKEQGQKFKDVKVPSIGSMSFEKNRGYYHGSSSSGSSSEILGITGDAMSSFADIMSSLSNIGE